MLEAAFFNWKCVVCSILAKSPGYLEEQCLVEHGPYVDIDDTVWVKCAKCEAPFHMDCLPCPPPPGRGPFICTFFACKC